MILNEDLKNKIKNLFQEKKFIELINLIQNKIEPNQRPASLWNLMGVARLSKKNPTKENLVLAINDFITFDASGPETLMIATPATPGPVDKA